MENITSWKVYKIGKFLKKSLEKIDVCGDEEYRQVTVKLNCNGVILRGIKKGDEIGTKKQFIAHKGQFILSRIDARNGAFGIVPYELDGAIVTGDFPLFDFDHTVVDAHFFNYFIRSNQLLEACKRASKGTTNRQRLKESLFLSFEVSLPSLEDQKQIVEKLVKIELKLLEAKKLRESTNDTLKNYFEIFQKDLIAKNQPKYVSLDKIITLDQRKVEVFPDQDYPEIGIYCFGNGIFHKLPRTGFEVGDKDLYEINSGDFIMQITFAWEGALAIAGFKDDGLFGSVRYKTFQVNESVCTKHYLLTYLLSKEGLNQIGKISPGSAGRNRVLSMKRIGEIQVPVIPIKEQEKFSQEYVERISTINESVEKQTRTSQLLFSSILFKTFKV